MALLDLLGRRHALRVIWELREQRLSFAGFRTAAAGQFVGPQRAAQRVARRRNPADGSGRVQTHGRRT